MATKTTKETRVSSNRETVGQGSQEASRESSSNNQMGSRETKVGSQEPSRRESRTTTAKAPGSPEGSQALSPEGNQGNP
jgi:hypothetical protein